MGRGGLGHRGPVTKCKNFHKQKPQPRQKKRQRHRKPRRARHLGREQKISGVRWFSKRVLVNQKEQIYII